MSTQQIIKEEKFIQCLYHIKDADGIGYYSCQGPIDHPEGKHTLPERIGYNKVRTIGQWWPTFEDAVRNNK